MFADLARLLFGVAKELAVVAALVWLVLEPPIWVLLPLVLVLG